MFSRWSKTFAFAVVACTLAISTATAHAELVEALHNLRRGPRPARHERVW